MYATLILKNLACTGDQIQFVKLNVETSESVASYESFQLSSLWIVQIMFMYTDWMLNTASVNLWHLKMNKGVFSIVTSSNCLIGYGVF